MLALILCAVLSQSPMLEGDPALVDLVRDALVANRSAYRTGRISGNSENIATLKKGECKESSVFEIWWDESVYFAKFKIWDNQNVYSPRPVEFDPDEDANWEYILHLKDRIYVYFYNPSLLVRYDVGRYPTAQIELTPWTAWFRYRPPYGRGGTLWVDMLAPDPPPLENKVRYRIEREGRDLIRETYRYPDGASMSVLFSMALDGNVVEISSRVNDPSQECDQGKYSWRRSSNGLCVLDGWDFSITRGAGDPSASTLKMRVKSVDTKTPIDPARFTLDYLLTQLPKNLILQDNVTRTRTKVNLSATPPSLTDDLGKLAKPLRGRGFLKPGR